MDGINKLLVIPFKGGQIVKLPSYEDAIATIREQAQYTPYFAFSCTDIWLYTESMYREIVRITPYVTIDDHNASLGGVGLYKFHELNHSLPRCIFSNPRISIQLKKKAKLLGITV